MVDECDVKHFAHQASVVVREHDRGKRHSKAAAAGCGQVDVSPAEYDASSATPADVVVHTRSATEPRGEDGQAERPERNAVDSRAATSVQPEIAVKTTSCGSAN